MCATALGFIAGGREGVLSGIIVLIIVGSRVEGRKWEYIDSQ